MSMAQVVIDGDERLLKIAWAMNRVQPCIKRRHRRAVTVRMLNSALTQVSEFVDGGDKVRKQGSQLVDKRRKQ